MADKGLAWVFQRGSRDWNSLDEKERAVALHIFYSFYKVFENAYIHYLDKSLDENVWVQNSKILLVYAAQPGSQYYLSKRMAIFDPRFQEVLKSVANSELDPGHVVMTLERIDVNTVD